MTSLLVTIKKAEETVGKRSLENKRSSLCSHYKNYDYYCVIPYVRVQGGRYVPLRRYVIKIQC